MILAIAAIGAAVLLGTRTVALWLARPLVMADTLRHVDAIVVLGGGVYSETTLSPESAYGLLHGIQLLRSGHARLLILSGGSHKGTRITDAEAMARLAESLGVEGTSIILDPNPSSTVAQARSVAKLAPHRGIRTVALVTSPLRSRRAALTFRRAGLEVVSSPGLTDPAGLLVAQDHPGRRLQVSVDALYEYAVLTVYRWRGHM